MSRLLVGCQPTSGAGPTLFTFELERDSGLLSPSGDPCYTDEPLFLAADRYSSRFYSLSDDNGGFLNAFARDPGSELVRHVARVQSAGRGPCHGVTPSPSLLAVANYWGGNVAIHPLDHSGAVGSAIQLLPRNGSGADPVRQDSSHPHAVVAVPAGDRIAVADLGLDELLTYRLVAGPRPFERTPAISSTGPGRGPRRVLFAGDTTAYVVNELSSSVSTYRYNRDSGVFSSLAECSTIIGQPQGEANYPADLALSGDASFLYVTNRGRDTISVFAAGDDSLLPVAEVGSGGAWPLAILSTATHLYVANEHSDNVTAFRVTAANGMPELIQQVPVPGPTCLLGS